MGMECEYEDENLPYKNDVDEDKKVPSNIEEQEENISPEKVNFFLILPCQKSFCFKFLNDAVCYTIFIFQYFHII